MATSDEVYRKFGDAAEATALIETELGNTLLSLVEDDTGTPPTSKFVHAINRKTFGELLNRAKKSARFGEKRISDLEKALDERNRLFHHFYRHHNIRISFDDGRAIMLADLDVIHSTFLTAYRSLMLAAGIDLDAPPEGPIAVTGYLRALFDRLPI